MRVYTIGFTQKSAESFFEQLRERAIGQLVDVRLHNSSQLAGFSKRDDLAYFLRQLCNADYKHEPLLAPETEMLDAYKKARLPWKEYERQYLQLLRKRKIQETIVRDLFFKVPTVLLCSEATAERCHRRLILEYLQEYWDDLEVCHL
jgi:uncharacterized protein (DUF488 family)